MDSFRFDDLLILYALFVAAALHLILVVYVSITMLACVFDGLVWCGKRQLPLALGLVAFCLSILAVWAWFLMDHGRLPVGSGEVINWLFGL
jgi:hypothetical protein